MLEVSSSFLNIIVAKRFIISTCAHAEYQNFDWGAHIHTFRIFLSSTMRKVIVCFKAKLSQATKHEWLTSQQNRGSGNLQHHPRNFSSNRQYQLGKSCVLSFETRKGCPAWFYALWWYNILCNIVWDPKKLCRAIQNEQHTE